jgi:hypothetical protein
MSISLGLPAGGQELPEKVGVDGGLIVCVGCGDPDRLAALRCSPAYVVQGLDRSPAGIREARLALRGKGQYGPVSVRLWDGQRLPYVDNLVNLIVADEALGLPMEEVMRVLAPRGVAVIGGKTTVKAVPGTIDDWTHYLHDADGNALADDQVVGPPRHVQWRSEPDWGRHHHAEKGGAPTVRTVLSAAGRLFLLMDETESSNMSVPSTWSIVARDAFSGVHLWTTPIETGNYTRDIPGIWRRLVVDDKRVYTAFGGDNQLKALDAATGRVVLSYEGAADLDELVKDGETLFALLRSGTLLALSAADGKTRWRWQPQAGETVAPVTLAVSGGRVFMKTGQVLTCLSASTGDTLYRSDLPGATKEEDSILARSVYYPGKLLVSGGVVLC